ncbi:MAG: monovalent cation/H(+) antiporter subunit G [Pseudomonadota bacterium]
MTLVLDLLSWLCLLGGGFFVIIGAVGVLRFPDFYTRMHAAGITDTLGADLILVGLLFQVPDAITAVKLLLIIVFFVLTSPVATHCVAHAAYAGREAPLTGRLLLRQNVPMAPEDEEASAAAPDDPSEAPV